MDTLQLPKADDSSMIKANSMPIKDQLAGLIKAHKRSASSATASSSCNSERYALEAEKLDWTV